MEVQLSFFGPLIELTPSGDHESATGLVSTQICGVPLGCYTYKNKSVYSFIQHTKVLIELIFCLKNYGKQ